MMKFISILSILLISFTIQSEIGGAGRDFLTGLLTVVKGKDIIVDEACLGKEFDNDVANLMDAIKKRDLILIMGYFGKVTNDIGLKCPSSDLVQIQKDTVALGAFELMRRINKHKEEVLEMLKKEFIKGKITASTIGEACGHIINIWIYEKSEIKAISFLAEEEHDFPLVLSGEQLIYGFFEGVSSVPVTQNKCLHDVHAAKDDIVAVVTDLFDGINSNNFLKILASFGKLQEILSKIKDLATTCNFAKLIDSLSALGTESGITKLGWSVISNLNETVEDVKQIEISIKGQDYDSSGKAMGDLFKVLLNYSTN